MNQSQSDVRHNNECENTRGTTMRRVGVRVDVSKKVKVSISMSMVRACVARVTTVCQPFG